MVFLESQEKLGTGVQHKAHRLGLTSIAEIWHAVFPVNRCELLQSGAPVETNHPLGAFPVQKQTQRRRTPPGQFHGAEICTGHKYSQDHRRAVIQKLLLWVAGVIFTGLAPKHRPMEHALSCVDLQKQAAAMSPVGTSASCSRPRRVPSWGRLEARAVSKIAAYIHIM